MPPADRLYDLCADILAAVETYYTLNALPLPARRYVSHQPFPAQPLCEQVTVGAGPLGILPYEGDVNALLGAANVQAAGYGMRAVDVGIGLSRCVPNITQTEGGIPVVTTEADEDAASRLVYADAYHVDKAVRDAHRAGTIGRCANVMFVGWQNPGTQGKYTNPVWTFRCGLE